MHNHPVSVGKRPDLKSSGSANWSWPRLVSIHEQQSRSSQGNHSSENPSLSDRIEQEQPPTAMISKSHTEGDTSSSPDLSPVLSAAGGSSTAGQAVEDSTHKHNSVSEQGSVQDLGEKSASATENEHIENVAEQGETEIPVGSEETSTHLPLSVWCTVRMC